MIRGPQACLTTTELLIIIFVCMQAPQKNTAPEIAVITPCQWYAYGLPPPCLISIHCDFTMMLSVSETVQ